MTPDQIDRLHLALTNMILLDDGEEPITLHQLHEAATRDPIEYADQSSKVAKLVDVVLNELQPSFLTNAQVGLAEDLPPAVRQTQPELRLLYETAAKGFHVSQSYGAEDMYHHVSKFQTMADLHAYEDAWRAAMMAAARDGR